MLSKLTGTALAVHAEQPKPTPETAIHTFTTSLATITGDVNVTIRAVLKNGEPWFVAKDATDALGYANGRKAVSDHVEEHQRGSVTFRDGTSARGGNPNKTIVSEGGLYALIMGSLRPELSKLPQAILFKRWVFETVLPSIRKNGGYILGQEKVATGEDQGELPRELMALAAPHYAPGRTAKKPQVPLIERPRSLPAVVQPSPEDVEFVQEFGRQVVAATAPTALSWSDIVFEKDGVALADSRKVAEVFGKEHKNVLRDIRRVTASGDEWDGLNFERVEYRDAKGESRDAYHLTRDGFAELVMGC